MSICGLDFGTSNTTLGTIDGRTPALAPLEAEHTTIPSAIFYEANGNVLIGRRAMEAYIEGTAGRLMRSLKSVLGTSLIEETTRLGRARVGFRDVIAYYVGAVKRRAEQATGRELRRVVHGRPVHFVDNAPDADRKAEETLRSIAKGAGFDEVTFQFEPIAAALDYERQITSEELALIADIGGGTSDFSIVRLGPERHGKADRAADILANDGVRIGGTDFDRQLSLGVVMPLFGFRSAMKRAGLDVPSSYFHDLATWSSINRMYESRVIADIRQVRQQASRPELLDRLIRVIHEQRGHTLAMEVEDAKIALSEKPRADIPLEWVAPGLSADVDRPDLVSHTKQLADRIAARIRNCLVQAGLAAGDIDSVFLTGGSVKLAHVQKAITKAVPAARIVEGDIFGAVGKGLTLEALRRYGPAN
ncbi:heat-shock protein [Bradyrhizobium lablabi]|uniref:Heat-shock protein n=1 Tax=Bradyrhizobium lablabi TaxID=722472 RepID=A0A0R3N2V0_9BRAD|nr:Hsp70 family protein [Bradyrhizobium lablabi]KRR26284.1 heat-shock protein [Bradyrhizobium lablabi]